MNSNARPSFFDYLNEASQTVSKWPAWKKEGADASKLQCENKKTTLIKQINHPLILKKS